LLLGKTAINNEISALFSTGWARVGLKKGTVAKNVVEPARLKIFEKAAPAKSV
jgi:hypothetical protein